MFKRRILFFYSICFCIASGLIAAQKTDIKGSSDHPLISRYPGSVITGYSISDFDEFELPLGLPNKKAELTKVKKIEGKLSRITYSVPKGISTLQVFRNYQSAIVESGFKILFSASGKSLDNGSYRKWPDIIYPVTNRFAQLRGKSENQRYLSAELEKSGKKVFLSLYVSQGWYPYTVVQLDILESKKMDSDLITVNAESLKNDLNEKGSAVLNGIYFDTDSTELKTSSLPALKEVAKLLKNNPGLIIFVVGHTDNEGNLSHNMTLSTQRAESVKKELVEKFNIEMNRLNAYGVGPLSPVLSNNTKAGRAKNRRVEIVEQ